ncbi:MAG TPA: hypothetical protein VJT50_05380 [Pyrinomonadaceae bacterium]|nr:hypothetical protein [Pyrinomonadaceae bacterium]
MKTLLSGLVLFLAVLTSSTSQSLQAQSLEDQPTRFSLRTLAPYNSYRNGYETLPVRVLGGGGGKLGAREKFRIHISMIGNYTSKKVVAVKFSFLIFKFSDWDALVGMQQTDLVSIELAPFERRQLDLVIGYVDDIPLLSYKPEAQFHMELAVTEVHYDDGSIWQGTDLPQKRNLPHSS